ncbi:MAG TPA: hypothetical protein VLI90_16360 [Tepidisphaeraceae bacterium]|nr:hypothetical protein [Tepidisphaeraceae bacterium]
MEGRSNLFSLFMFAVTLPVTAVVLIAVAPKLAASDDGRLILVLLVAPLSLALVITLIKIVATPAVRYVRLAWLKRHQPDAEYGVTPPRCKGCGYDLRASPDQCPECGTPVDGMDGTIIRYLIKLRRLDELNRK